MWGGGGLTKGAQTGTGQPPPPTLQPPPLSGPRPSAREFPHLARLPGAHPPRRVCPPKPLRPGAAGRPGSSLPLLPRGVSLPPEAPPPGSSLSSSVPRSGGHIDRCRGREGDRGLPEAVISIPDSIGWGWCLETGPQRQDILPSQGPAEEWSFRGRGSRERGISTGAPLTNNNSSIIPSLICALSMCQVLCLR